MKINLLFFGPLTDITGCSATTVEEVKDIETLLEKISIQYPGLKNQRFVIAVNHDIVKTNTPLPDKSEVAFLPPYAGG